MRPRDIFLLIGVTVFAAAVLALAFGGGAEAAEQVPFESDPGEEFVEIEEPTSPPPSVEVATGAFERSGSASPESDRATAEIRPGASPRDGVLEGAISMPTDLLGVVTSYRVRLVEMQVPVDDTAAESRPRELVSKAFEIPYDHTPRFRIEEIPFSRYGYRAELLVRRSNGGSAIVRIDEDHPFAETRLSITKPVTFTVRIQDQHHNAHAEWPVVLRPVGDPPGREVHSATTDRFGTALFREVVAGDYVVWHDGAELDTVEVAPITFPRRGQPIRVQSAMVTVPVGKELRVEVFGPGMGLPDTELVLQKTDTVQNRRFEAVTDRGGIHTFRFLEAGRYQLDIHRDGFQRTTRTVRIEEEENPEVLIVRLAPTR